MEKLIFEELEGKKNDTTVVRVSRTNHERILEISRRSSLTAYAVVDRLLGYALERVEWDKN